MYFELARMFGAHKPTDFPAMPVTTFLKYRAYYAKMGEQADEQRRSVPTDPDVNVIDFDKDILKRKS